MPKLIPGSTAERKEVVILNYHPIINLSTGAIFGEMAFLNQFQKRLVLTFE